MLEHQASPWPCTGGNANYGVYGVYGACLPQPEEKPFARLGFGHVVAELADAVQHVFRKHLEQRGARRRDEREHEAARHGAGDGGRGTAVSHARRQQNM